MCEYVRLLISCFFKVRDLSSLGVNLRRIEEVEDVVGSKNLQHGCEVTRICSQGREVKFAFFVPSNLSSFLSKPTDLISADAAHKLNSGGCILLHAITVDNIRVRRHCFMHFFRTTAALVRFEQENPKYRG